MESESADGSKYSYLITAVIGVSGLVLLLWSILEPVYLFSRDSPVIYESRYQIGYLTILPSCVGMLYASRWLRRSDVPAGQYRRISVYWLVGGFGFLLFNIGLMTYFPAESVWIVANWVRWALTLGLAVGLVIGITQARAIFGTLDAERQSLRAEHVKEQRDLIDQMNGILRHEVLNSAQVITGNASLLMESDQPIDPSDERLRRINRHGEELTEVISEVRVLLGAIQDDRALEPKHLTDVVEAEARKVEDQYPGIDVDLRCRDEVYVLADGLLGRIFGNLLRNAVEHNDTEPLRVTVDVETVDGSAVVTVEDNGNGIPEHERESLFQHPRLRDHGLGLYLVHELANSYDGTVELLETGPEGTAIECRFPVTEPPESDSSTE